MFSVTEKQFIAAHIETILNKLHHPEMPSERPMFTLHVQGKESWSWAEIKPNWTFDSTNPPKVNLWNEHARKHMGEI